MGAGQLKNSLAVKPRHGFYVVNARRRLWRFQKFYINIFVLIKLIIPFKSRLALL